MFKIICQHCNKENNVPELKTILKEIIQSLENKMESEKRRSPKSVWSTRLALEFNAMERLIDYMKEVWLVSDGAQLQLHWNQKYYNIEEEK